MGDYQHTATVNAEPGVLFDYLADVENLPHYFISMRSAEPAEGDTVHTVADVDGTRREGDAWFTAEHESRTIRWGAPGPHDYSGELTVTGAESGSRVTVRLHTEHVDGGDIVRGLEETLAAIKQNVEDGTDAAAP